LAPRWSLWRGSQPEDPSRKPLFWKGGASTCAKALRAERERPCLRFYFLAFKMLLALGIDINKWGLRLLSILLEKKKPEQSHN